MTLAPSPMCLGDDSGETPEMSHLNFDRKAESGGICPLGFEVVIDGYNRQDEKSVKKPKFGFIATDFGIKLPNMANFMDIDFPGGGNLWFKLRGLGLN
jgi:hypothetical protein